MTTGVELRYRPVDIARLLGRPEPTPEQAAVIQAPLGPAVVIAGAGSGKTETMAARVVWLVANGLVAPERILGLTFTRKAAGELQQRIRHRLRSLYAVLGRERAADALPFDALPFDAAGEPTVLTYAAYAGRLVDEHGILLGREPDTRLLSEAARWQLADAAVRDYAGEFSLFPGVIATVTERVLDLAGQLADHLATAGEVRELSQRLIEELQPLDRKPRSRTREWPEIVEKLLHSLVRRCELLPLVDAFADRKRAEGVLDFADHMVLASRLAGRSQVAAAERARYDAVLLDEYQDTGFAQIEMLAGLFADGRAVTAVGDPLQSIYSWRGASAGNIDRFAHRFRAANGEPAASFGLATSWRNDRRVLAVANGVAEPLRSGSEPPLVERPAAEDGAVRIRFAASVRDEAAWLAERLRVEWDTRTDWTDGQRTLAVLVRKRSAIGLIAQAVREAGLPVEVVDIGGLLNLPEVADVRAMLTVLTDHNAGGSLNRLLTGARWRIGPADLVALHEHARQQARRTSGAIGDFLREVGQETAARDATEAGSAGGSSSGTAPSGTVTQAPAERDETGRGVSGGADGDRDERVEPSLIEALDDLTGTAEAGGFSDLGHRRLSECAAMLRRLRRRLELPLPDLIAEIEIELGLDVEVAARPGNGPSAIAGRANLDRFADEAARFTADRSGTSVTAFLGYLKAAEQEEYGLKPATVDVTPDRIQVLTVHGSKGLEWDVVAVAGLVTDGFPDQPKSHDWTSTPALLPSPLRGDAGQRPGFDFAGCEHRGDAEDRLLRHRDELKLLHLREERRLAYVAFTRARKALLASGAAWGSGNRPRPPSVFLTELRENPVTQDDGWHEVAPEEANPQEAAGTGLSWPFDPLGDRRPVVQEAADRVGAALAATRTAEALERTAAEPASAAPPSSTDVADSDTGLDGEHDVPARWARDVELLLAERAAAATGDVLDVALPAQLSVSDVVTLSADPQGLARRLRRPLPQRPVKQARRGTAFHEWLESRWSADSLLDVDDLPGAADELSDAAELQALRTAFEASAWADRTPVAVEVGFEMALGSRVIRGRMDAVFRDPDGGYTVVDWKTGRPPERAEADHQAVQLAFYRLAWAALNGIAEEDLHTVRAAFHYVRANRTVAPADLLDADRLQRLIGGEYEPSEQYPSEQYPSEQRASDIGYPVLDYGPPPEDYEPPPEDYELPPEDYELPPEDDEPPPEDDEPPPEDYRPLPEDYLAPDEAGTSPGGADSEG